jgi:serine/threonine protein kinase
MLGPGTILQNRYRIASPLGQGGMGAVYRAWDMRLNIPVAVKEMIPQPGLDPQTLAQLRQQFYQEAQVLARLNHPNLVRVTDYFEEWGNAYLVMDFAEGQSLADLIAARGPLPEAQVLDWARQLLDALAYCHAQGVVHRDIKPQNIIIRADGRPILADFGLVKLWDPRDPRTRTVVRAMGTPEYAPPEQWGAGHTDPRSDLYSLGATLYHALTGQAPATATDRFAEPGILTPPCSITPSLRPETERAILRAMELAKDARWGSAAEMAAALGAPAAAPTPVAKPVPPQPTRVIAEEQPQPTRVIPEPSPQPVRVTAETPPQPTRVITEAPPPAIPARSRIPVWAWVLGGIVFLSLVLGLAWAAGQIPPGSIPTPTTTTGQVRAIATPTATIDADPTVYDNFNNPANEGSFNQSRWRYSTDTKPPRQIIQQSGVLVVTQDGKSGRTALTARKYAAVTLNARTFFEARLKISPDQYAGNVQLHLRTWTSDWFSECNISEDASAGCWDTIWPIQNGHVYESIRKQVGYGTWHTFRIEVDPLTMTFTYYMDGQMIGSHIPVDAEKLKKARFEFLIGVWSPSPDAVTGYIDDVRIGNY